MQTDPEQFRRIFIVEDDPALGQAMLAGLTKSGYECQLAHDFSAIEQECIDSKAHLVIMDVNLPHFDGFHWCRTLRTRTRLPILFVTARGSDQDLVQGIGAGGDDYLLKPFSLEVLVAKIQALVRRSYQYHDTQAATSLEYLGLRLELGTLQLFAGNQNVELTRHEFGLLRSLMEARGTIVSRQNLMNAVWHGEVFVDDNTLTVNINRLRKRLADLGYPDLVQTRKQQGYTIP